jgi:hypothetical protein
MKEIGRERNVRYAGDAEWLPIVQCFQFGKFFQIFLEEIPDFPDNAPALAGAHLRPWAGFECAPRGSHSEIDVGLIAFSDAGENLAGCRIDGIEGLARMGLNPFAIDEKFSWSC